MLNLKTQKKVLLAAPEVLAVPIRECGEKLVDVRRNGGIVFGPVPECPQTEPYYTLIRESVFKKLLEAQSYLPQGLKLRLYEGLRSLDVQQLLFSQELERVNIRSSGLEPKAAFLETMKLVSPVENLDGTKNTPPHSTGGAVDVEIIDASGKVLDFGMEIKDWSAVDPDICITSHPGISDSACRNRELLVNAMLRAGFVNYFGEWWHFSYGDRYWAYQTKTAAAIYGRCDPLADFIGG